MHPESATTDKACSTPVKPTAMTQCGTHNHLPTTQNPRARTLRLQVYTSCIKQHLSTASHHDQGFSRGCKEALSSCGLCQLQSTMQLNKKCVALPLQNTQKPSNGYIVCGVQLVQHITKNPIRSTVLHVRHKETSTVKRCKQSCTCCLVTQKQCEQCSASLTLWQVAAGKTSQEAL